jgi:hypothetical protein
VSEQQSPKPSRVLAEQADAEALFRLAGFKVTRVWELVNGYWPSAPSYDSVRTPWWLLMTEIGPVRIGWRKRVIEIEWDATPVRVEVTPDDVTKSETMVHAWSTAKAFEYLASLRRLAQEAGHV